jgi:hypothetical protein
LNEEVFSLTPSLSHRERGIHRKFFDGFQEAEGHFLVMVYDGVFADPMEGGHVMEESPE